MDNYDKECKKIEKENAKYLKLFDTYLTKQNLTDKTIRKHLSNVDFYLNVFLLSYEPLHMNEGTSHIDEYLGYFFIRKCMWSTPESIKTTAASIKKFYKCMLDNQKIDKEAYDYLCGRIKNGIEDWQADCAEFNNPESINPFMFM